jgi:DNA adenine methylase
MTVQDKKDYLIENFNLNQVYATRVAYEIDKEFFNDEYIARFLGEKPKPFVKWVGGKRQLLKQFKDLALYPPEHFDPVKNHYFEPFVGGGAVFFDLLPLKAHISDINVELVTTYNVIKSSLEKLILELQNGKYLYDKDIFLDIRSWDTTTISDIRRAARFIYLNRTAFNGLYRVNKSGGFNVPFGKYTNPQILDENNLRKVSEALKNVAISNLSYKHVLDKAKIGDFIYFDPPYYPVSRTASFTAYSSDSFLEKEQEELRDTFLELHKRGCYVMLSNSDTSFSENLFKKYKKDGISIHRVHAGRAINSNSDKRGKITEIIVTNY